MADRPSRKGRPPRGGAKRPGSRQQSTPRTPSTVDDRVEEARDRAAEAEVDAARASRERLEALLALPPRQAMHRLNDADLSPADRGRLRDALAARTPRWKGWVGGDRSRRPAWPRLPRAVRRTMVALAPLALIAVGAFAAAWWRTPFPARTVVEAEIAWRYPNGRITRVRVPAGSPVDAQRSFDPTVTIHAPVEGQGGFAVARVDPRLVGR